MKNADVADVPSRPGGADGLHYRLLGADRLDDRVSPEAVRELLDPFDAVVTALLDDLGRTELQREFLPVLVTAHDDDRLRTELLGGQHGEQTDRTVTDHSNGPARSCVGGNSTEPAGAEDIRGGEQARDEVIG